MNEEWDVVDFRPAPGGWYVVYIDEEADDTDPEPWWKEPLTGWLIEKGPLGQRRVIAAQVGADGEVESLDVGAYMGSTLRIIGPGQPEPTVAAVRQEMTFRLAMRQRHFERLDEKIESEIAAKRAARQKVA